MNKDTAITILSDRRSALLDEYHLQKAYSKEYVNAADKIEALEASDNALEIFKALDFVLNQLIED